MDNVYPLNLSEKQYYSNLTVTRLRFADRAAPGSDRDGAFEHERELTAQRFGTGVVPLANGVNAHNSSRTEIFRPTPQTSPTSIRSNKAILHWN